MGHPEDNKQEKKRILPKGIPKLLEIAAKPKKLKKLMIFRTNKLFLCGL